MSGYDAQTLAFYAAEAPVYTASGTLGVSRHLDCFLDRLPAGADILELGCGGGRYFNCLAREELESVYRKAAMWDLLDISEGIGGGYDGAQGPWAQITPRRPP